MKRSHVPPSNVRVLRIVSGGLQQTVFRDRTDAYGENVKNPLDAARVKLSIVTHDMPKRERERIVSQLAKQCTADQLADLIDQALDLKQQAEKELSYAKARLRVLLQARAHITQPGEKR